MPKAIRIVHFVLLTSAAIACVVFGMASGLPWAGSAVAVLLGSKAARSAFFLMPRVAMAQTAGPIASMIFRLHGVGYFGAALLFVASALAAESPLSGAMAAGTFVAAALNFWLWRRTNAVR